MQIRLHLFIFNSFCDLYSDNGGLAVRLLSFAHEARVAGFETEIYTRSILDPEAR